MINMLHYMLVLGNTVTENRKEKLKTQQQHILLRQKDLTAEPHLALKLTLASAFRVLGLQEYANYPSYYP